MFFFQLDLLHILNLLASKKKKQGALKGRFLSHDPGPQSRVGLKTAAFQREVVGR